MATGPSHPEPVTADDVLTVQFTLIKKGGYDQQEVDAFLDRIAATIEADPSVAVDGSVTADDIRGVAFEHKRRGGYDPAQVDTLLDRVLAAFTAQPVADPLTEPLAAAPDPVAAEPLAALPDPVAAEPIAPDPEPAPVVPDPEPVAVVPDPTPSPAPAVAGEAPRLHDPEGAAQKLLAAAQLAADTLTADAEAYAAQVRADADGYAASTRSEADTHAATVTNAAEAQAAAIREVAADEARRVAEEARAGLLSEITSLEARKTVLEADNAALQAELDAERNRILSIIDDLRAAVTGNEPPTPPADAAALPDVADELDAAFGDVADEAAIAAPVSDHPPTEGAALGATAADETAIDDTVAEETPEETVAEDLAPVADPDAIIAVDPDADADDGALAPVIALGADVDPEPEVESEADVDAAARSVFDVPTEADADTSADWLDDPGQAQPASIFDIEAEAGGGDATQAMPAVETGAGDRFFDELRQADTDGDALGPVDEDTDAALSAFFDEGEETPTEGRWRNRFGPGRE